MGIGREAWRQPDRPRDPELLSAALGNATAVDASSQSPIVGRPRGSSLPTVAAVPALSPPKIDGDDRVRRIAHKYVADSPKLVFEICGNKPTAGNRAGFRLATLNNQTSLPSWILPFLPPVKIKHTDYWVHGQESVCVESDH
jgi:hypothetical protein